MLFLRVTHDIKYPTNRTIYRNHTTHASLPGRWRKSSGLLMLQVHVKFEKEIIMNKLICRFISLIAAFTLVFGDSFVTLVSAASNTYYVSTTGSDSNSGSLSAPFKTFAKAISILQAGDTLRVEAGVYTEPLTLSKSGTASASISVIGDRAILNMQGTNPNGVNVSGSYVYVSGLEVIGATDFGILVTGKYVTIENNIVHDDVTRNGVGTCGLSTSWGSAVKVKVGGENITIRNNTVYNNCGEGIAVTRGLTALVENNTVYDNFGVNIYVDNSPFVTVRNNVSYCTGTHLRNGNRATGIALGEESYSGWGAQLHDVLIVNNTITECSTGVAAYESNVGGILANVTISTNKIPSGEKRGISIQTLTNQNVMVSNNTVFNSIYVLQPVGVTLTGNIIETAPAATNTPLPTNTVAASPTFTSTSTLPSATNTAAPIVSPTPTETVPPLPAFTATPLPTLPAFTSTAVTTTFGTTPTIPAGSEIVYDDKDSQFVYSSGWNDMNKTQAYNGSYKLTNKNGATVTLPFTGQSFSILYNGGSAYRKMDVYVDGVLVGTINQRTASSTFQLRWNYNGLLVPGSHVLKLVFVTPNTSNKTNGSIDAVVVQ